MARFDVYRGNGTSDYLVDVQSDFHHHLRTRMVIPLRTIDKVVNPTKGLQVPITVGSQKCYLITPMMGAISTHQLGKPIGNIHEQAGSITAAIDFLLQGF